MGGFGFMQNAISSLKTNREMMVFRQDRMKDRYRSMVSQKALLPSKDDFPQRSNEELEDFRKTLRRKSQKDNRMVILKTTLVCLVLASLVVWLFS